MFRANKSIGKSLEAVIVLNLPSSANPVKNIVQKYVLALPELFNVSTVELVPVEETYPTVRTNKVSTAPKCDRCWRHVPDVGQYPAYPTVCLRCVEALDAIDFPPCPAT
jgi:isoleucyl-tRNA synthetase